MKNLFNVLAVLSFLVSCAPAAASETPTSHVPETPLTETEEPEPTPELIPLGGRIAYTSERDGNLEIFSVNDHGGYLARLVSHPADDYQPAWSPDGKQLAFVSERDGNPEIYLLDLGAGEFTRITHIEAADTAPTWSPDGRKIAFTSDRDGAKNIYVMDLITRTVTQLTDEAAPDYAPDWSPDSKLLAFVSERDGDPEIYTVESNGGRPQRLTDHKGKDDAPAWSPDGQQIAYVSERGDRDQIMVMSNRGRNPEQITNSPGRKAAPTWGKNDRSILFSIEVGNGNWDLASVDLTTKDLTWLARNLQFDGDPSWSVYRPMGKLPWFGVPGLMVDVTGDGVPNHQAVQFNPESGVIYFSFGYQGMEPGQAWRQVWRYQNGKEVVVSGFWDAGENGLMVAEFLIPEGYPEGLWQLELFLGENLVQTLFAQPGH